MIVCDLKLTKTTIFKSAAFAELRVTKFATEKPRKNRGVHNHMKKKISH